MALDTLILGPFVFTDFQVPDRMPYGGKQQTVVHKMPGGYRVVDCMGPDDNDRCWSGIMWGGDALADMQTLDALRSAGAELPFSWGAESRLAVIGECKFEVEKFNCIHYDISVILSDDSGSGGSGFGFGLDAMVGADLGAALSLA